MLPFVRTSGGVCVFCNNKQYLVRRENFLFKKLMEEVNGGNADEFLRLLNQTDSPASIVNNVTNGRVSFENFQVCQNGQPVENEKVQSLFSNRIEQYLRDGLSIMPILNFIENLLDNPSKNSLEQAYEFLEKNNLPLTDDGHFLAYKSVQNDYKDKHSGTYDNKPGEIIETSRNAVDDNPERACSYGFHVGALEYSGPNGWYNNQTDDKCIIVKVNPKDVVAVTNDHNHQKCRVCRYEVLSDYDAKLSQPCYKATGEELSPYDYDGVNAEDFGDIRVDDEIVFNYTDRYGVTKTRFATVDHIDYDNESLTCLLDEEEEYSGCYRRFSWDNMTDVRIKS